MNTETTLAGKTAAQEKNENPQWHAAPKTRRFASSEDVYNTILWRLSSQQSAGQTMAVGITGCKPKSGTTTMAAKLALQAGSQQAGRVLLIDANGNSPSLKNLLDLAPNSGLGDILSGDIAPRECEPEQITENLFVLSCGNVHSKEGTRVNRQLAKEMMEQFRSDYDLIIIDLPAAKELRSTLPLVKSLDGVLLVIRSETVKKPEIQRIAKNLRQDGVILLGTVLNRHREYVPRWLQKWF